MATCATNVGTTTIPADRATRTDLTCTRWMLAGTFVGAGAPTSTQRQDPA
jgi:hypothetical protein